MATLLSYIFPIILCIETLHATSTKHSSKWPPHSKPPSWLDTDDISKMLTLQDVEDLNDFYDYVEFEKEKLESDSDYPQSFDKMSLDDENEAARSKRLMGIFRCTGWGPGCGPINSRRRPKPQKDKTKSKGDKTENQVTLYNKLYRTGNQDEKAESQKENKVNSGKSHTSRGGGGRGARMHKFQPFFTLTSGMIFFYY